MKRIIILLLIFFAFPSIGQSNASPIELLDVVSGKNVFIKPDEGHKGVVVIFTSLSCPYDQHYRDRIKSLTTKYASSISFFLINSNPGNDESELAMNAAYNKLGLSIPYLSDKNQKAMMSFHVKRTPEVVLLKPDGKNQQVIYQGAIDDNPQVHHDTGQNFLDEAIATLLSGKLPRVATERAIGCTIRKKD